MKQNDIRTIVDEFKHSTKPEDRYSSFDYCYNYFHPSNRNNIGDAEKSCLVLGFYLASWGMLRGSSFLLSKSIKHYESTIDYILNCDTSYWDIDVSNYNDENINKIIVVYKDVREKLIKDEKTTHRTLVTKVLLGVFGFIPALDNNFITTFKQITNNECGFSVLKPDALKNPLKYIKNFYEENKTAIDDITIFTKDFSTGNPMLKYTKAKIIDMYGFQKYIIDNKTLISN
jgi:hypothetical protein